MPDGLTIAHSTADQRLRTRLERRDIGDWDRVEEHYDGRAWRLRDRTEVTDVEIEIDAHVLDVCDIIHSTGVGPPESVGHPYWTREETEFLLPVSGTSIDVDGHKLGEPLGVIICAECYRAGPIDDIQHAPGCANL